MSTMPASAAPTSAPSATVLAFSRARFTPGDLDIFESIAEAKLRDGHWAGVLRESGRAYDRLLVLLPELDRPVFRFERDADGRYSLSFHDRSGWYGLGTGSTAADCLAIWRVMPRKGPRKGAAP